MTISYIKYHMASAKEYILNRKYEDAEREIRLAIGLVYKKKGPAKYTQMTHLIQYYLGYIQFLKGEQERICRSYNSALDYYRSSRFHYMEAINFKKFGNSHPFLKKCLKNLGLVDRGASRSRAEMEKVSFEDKLNRCMLLASFFDKYNNLFLSPCFEHKIFVKILIVDKEYLEIIFGINLKELVVADMHRVSTFRLRIEDLDSIYFYFYYYWHNKRFGGLFNNQYPEFDMEFMLRYWGENNEYSHLGLSIEHPAADNNKSTNFNIKNGNNWLNGFNVGSLRERFDSSFKNDSLSRGGIAEPGYLTCFDDFKKGSNFRADVIIKA